MSESQPEILDSNIDLFWVINFGDITTIIGLSITILGVAYSIYVSTKAKSAAIAAKEAANSMKEKIFSIDTINDINNCISLFDDAKRNINTGNFQISAERTSEIRRLIAPIIHSDTVPFSDDVNKRLLELQGQLVSLSETLHLSGNKQMSVANKGALYQIIDAQIDSLSIAHNELRQGVEADNGR